MKRILVLAATATVLLSWSCARVPITNRRQFNLLPESEMMAMSFTEYQKVLSTSQIVPATDPNTVMVKKVGANISTAITNYLNTHKGAKRIKGFKWEFNLINDPKTINAWCMPGGKVCVYTGLLPVTKDEKGLAVVMGHEVAHAIARHGNERMSQQLTLQLGGAALSVATSQQPEKTQQIFNQCYGVGTTLGALAYSRKHETEADKLGLVFMAMAGYDPETAIGFWERMSAASQGSVPQFLSTHPSDQTRIKDLKAFMPTAKKYYKPSGK